MNSKHGCPIFGLTALWRWIDVNKILIGLFFLAGGLIMVEYGGKNYLISMATISTLSMMVLIVTILFTFILPTTTPQWLTWIVMFGSFGVGAGLGYGAY